MARAEVLRVRPPARIAVISSIGTGALVGVRCTLHLGMAHEAMTLSLSGPGGCWSRELQVECQPQSMCPLRAGRDSKYLFKQPMLEGGIATHTFRVTTTRARGSEGGSGSGQRQWRQHAGAAAQHTLARRSAPLRSRGIYGGACKVSLDPTVVLERTLPRASTPLSFQRRPSAECYAPSHRRRVR